MRFEEIGKRSDVAPLDLGGRVIELDGIRGIAVGMVVIWHYFIVQMQMHAPVRSAGAYVLAAGRLSWSGVDLFFVLSGFLIGGILLDARTASNFFLVFYTRRFFRIVPIYALLLAMSFLISTLVKLGIAPRLGILVGGALPWLPYILFLQNVWVAHASIWGSVLLGVTWSLAIEEQFYLTLPLIIRFATSRGLIMLLGAGVLLAPVLRLTVHMLWPNHWLASYTLMPCRADALLMGVLAAMFMRDLRCREWLDGHRTSLRCLLLVLVLGVAVLTKYAAYFMSPGPRGTLVDTVGYTWLAAFYVSVLLYVLTFRGSTLSHCLRWGWLRWLGSIAYGVYLFHYTILYMVYELIRSRVLTIHSFSDICVSILAIAVTLVVCWTSWILFEKPLVKMGHGSRRYQFRNDSMPDVAPMPIST